MRKGVVAAAAILLLVAVNWVIHAREDLLERGRVVYLELAPVDPRSMMQGDYMALRFRAAIDALGRRAAVDTEDGRLVLALDSRGVAVFRRIDDGTPLAADETAIRYRVRNGQPKFGTNAFFFEEGRGEDYAQAKYGAFRVAPDGDAILTRLHDANLVALGSAPRR